LTTFRTRDFGLEVLMTTTKVYYTGGRPAVPAETRWDERGEGVISAAIAVLVMAFIGVGMWFAFNATFEHAANHVDNQVNCVGSTNQNC
jgi:hypothetical protein